ncbi:MAG: hypothetical protein LBU34_14610 [Planctomycetaceae bacterium]|nr:hypothetical protein [Planctomycetaceae bacterium]
MEIISSIAAFRRNTTLALADNEFCHVWLFWLPIGKQPLGERLPTS